ncbi:C-type lectin domain-containing protein, partial [Salmonella sp. s51228]|uniref:C-type lectin domain-containing protein n=1 Tax=Salmonella sp. s51228 TaxID=3159652 RepID=UPI00397F3075
MITKLGILILFLNLLSINCSDDIRKMPKHHSCDGKSYNGNCYKLVTTHLNFPRAEQTCKDWSGHLTDIRSSNENNFLRALASNEKPWIGLS